MGNRGPLDMSQFEDDFEGDYELEIGEPISKGEAPIVNPNLGIPLQANPKFKDVHDYELDDKIKKYRSQPPDLNLKDPAKMDQYILDLESERRFRDMEKEKIKEKRNQGAKAAEKGFSLNGDNGRPMSTRASYRNVNDIYAQTDRSGRQSRYYAADSPPHSEELIIVNHTRGKGHSRQRSPNTEGSTLDGGKDTSRVSSGNLAGPSLRLGLRSSSKQCQCNELAGHCACRFYGKYSTYFTGKERLASWQSPKGNAAPRPASGRIGNGIKRAREGVGGGDSPEIVVELDSSEDEEDKEAEDTNVDCQMAPPRKAYGTRSALSPSLEGLKIAYPCRDDPASVEVASHDLPRLNPLEFLNDTVIDFYIKYMQRPENLTEEDKSRFYFFNSFFYKKLCDTVGGQNKKTQADLSKLKRWTKGTNIFEKEYLFVPIHEKWHWSLAIVCHPGATSEDTGRERCILHLDSMSPGHKSNNVFRLLRTYLIREWEHQAEKAEKDGLRHSFERLVNEDFSVKKIPVPQQENESDCGLFLLHYIELFLKDAPPAFKLSDVDEGRLFGRNWFKPYQASNLRRVIKELLLEFFEREASRDKEKTETIERPSLQNEGSQNLLQSGDVQHVLPSNVEVMKSVNSPGQCSPTALVRNQNMPDVDSSVVSTPKSSAMEDAEHHLSNDVVKMDEEDTGAPSQANCSDPRESSGLPTAPTLRSHGGSADNTKDMKMLNQFTEGNGHLGHDQNGISLVVDLSPRKIYLTQPPSINLLFSHA